MNWIKLLLQRWFIMSWLLITFYFNRESTALKSAVDSVLCHVKDAATENKQSIESSVIVNQVSWFTQHWQHIAWLNMIH
jgi:hypothetical protein